MFGVSVVHMEAPRGVRCMRRKTTTTRHVQHGRARTCKSPIAVAIVEVGVDLSALNFSRLDVCDCTIRLLGRTVVSVRRVITKRP